MVRARIVGVAETVVWKARERRREELEELTIDDLIGLAAEDDHAAALELMVRMGLTKDRTTS